MNLRVGFLTGVLLFAFFVPHASAQGAQCGAVAASCQTTIQLTIAPPTQSVKPLGPFIALPIAIEYSYAPSSGAIAPTPIQLSVTQSPPWAVATVSPTTVFADVSLQPGGAQQTKVTGLQSFVLVTATQDAPAFTQGIIEITANAPPNGNLDASQRSVQIPIQADFFSILEANTPNAIQKAKPQALVSYPVTVTNFGNAQTKVDFSIDEGGIPEKWQVALPPPVTLQARQQGQTQNTRTVNVQIQTPFQNGYMNVVGAITVRLRSNYALDAKVVGDSTIVSTLTTTKGFYVPGFEPLLALMAVGAVAAALAQRGDERRRR